MKGWIGTPGGDAGRQHRRVVGYPPAVGKLGRKQLDALVEEATIDHWVG
jgi:hypothetical protein